MQRHRLERRRLEGRAAGAGRAANAPLARAQRASRWRAQHQATSHVAPRPTPDPAARQDDRTDGQGAVRPHRTITAAQLQRDASHVAALLRDAYIGTQRPRGRPRHGVMPHSAAQCAQPEAQHGMHSRLTAATPRGP